MSQAKEPSEFEMIDSLHTRIKAAHSTSTRIRVGIGDDAAIVAPISDPVVLCSDAVVEGIHFNFDYMTFEEVGHKALASCLSDLAAMNAQPLHALVSIALPSSRRAEMIDGLYEGITKLSQLTGVEIVGGDLTRSPGPLFIDIACVGSTRNPTIRSGARKGDILAVSGTLGDSAAGLASLQRFGRTNTHSDLLNAHTRPLPRFDLLPSLVIPGLCTAMIDISDGLSSEVLHLSHHSHVCFTLDEMKLPISEPARALASSLGLSVTEWALNGGEDYQLLATFDPDMVRDHGLPRGFTEIGFAHSEGEHSTIIWADGIRGMLTSEGFRHF